MKFHAPSKQRPVIRSPLVKNIECPSPIQRTADKVAEISARQIRFREDTSGLNDRAIGENDGWIVIREWIVNTVQDVLRIHVPRIVKTLIFRSSQCISIQIFTRAAGIQVAIIGVGTCRPGSQRILHEHNRGSIRTCHRHRKVSNKAVFDVGCNQLQMAAILQCLTRLKHIDDQLRTKCHSGSIWQ